MLKFYSRLKQLQKNSVQDNRIDSTYIEYCIFNLIKTDLIYLIKSKSILAKEFHIQPSEIDMMPMWEYEYFIRFINDSIKEDNEKQQSEMDKYDINKYKNMTNSSYANKAMKPPTMTMPKMPSAPKF